MKSYLILISLLFLVSSTPEPSLRSLSSYVNPLTRVRKNIVDNALYSLPQRTQISLDGMISSMINAANSYSLAHCEVVYMIYRWIATNIEFDCLNAARYPSYVPVSDVDVYNQGKGGDQGFANLFKAFANRGFNFQVAILVGYSKVTDYVQGKLPPEPDHIWNGINFEGGSYLIDLPWGAGECYVDQFHPNYSDFYFCTDPTIFIRSHLPQEQAWQLLTPPKTPSEFVNMLKLTKNFYENGFTSMNPDKSTISASTAKFSFTINHNQVSKDFITQLYYPSGGSYQQQTNPCWIDKYASSATITCYGNYKGSNKLYLYGGAYGQDPLPFLLDYNVAVSQNAIERLNSPNPIKQNLQNKDFHLIEPIYNPLKRSRQLKFRIKTTDFSSIYIINSDYSRNNHHYRELDYSSGEFSGDYIYIFGSEVSIATYLNGQYVKLVTYETIRDTTKPVDATFPMAYAAPKNILYSPLLDPLRIRTTYKFKIKCPSCINMKVRDGNNFYDLTRSGQIFSRDIYINGGGDNYVDILNCDSYNQCAAMYRYTASYY